MDKRRQLLRDFALLTAGTALTAVGVYFFKFPNHFSTGGVTGLSVLLTRFFPQLPASTFAAVINVAFLLLGFAALNRDFGVRTVYGSLLFSGLLQGLQWLCPLDAPLTSQPLLELFFAVILPAIGSAILFNTEGSTGGTDIAAMILKKYTSLDIGRALLCCDVLIAASTLVIYNIEIGLYSVLGLILKSVLVDSVIESFNRRKVLQIITSDPEPVCAYITQGMHRSATVWQATGVYSGQARFVVLTALARHQAVALRRYLRREDPGAFVMIQNSSEIFGKGFLRG
ncbi:MAG: YitT family protein [Christensenellales bacterium]|jgi:uncharacterized membrane-anchored protein YitT (DUF2179 family)